MLRNGIDSAAAGMRRKDGLMKGQMEECGILWSPGWESIMVGYSMLVTAVVKQPHSNYSCSSNKSPNRYRTAVCSGMDPPLELDRDRYGGRSAAGYAPGNEGSKIGINLC